MRHAPLRFILVFSMMILSSCAGRYAGGDGKSTPALSGVIEQLWSVDVDQREPGDPEGFSYPAVVQVEVQTAEAAQTLIVIAGRDARVRVYDLHGRELRSVIIQEPSDSAALALENGLVVVGDVSGMIYGIDPLQGSIVWQQQISSYFLAQPVLLNDGFLVQTIDNHLYHFSSDGDKHWSYVGHGGGLSMYMTAAPRVIDKSVYALFSNGDAIALKADSGDLLWRKQLLLNTEAAVLSELRVAIATPVHLHQAMMGIEKVDDALLVAFYQGRVLILSRDDGRELFSKDISIKSTPLVDQGKIYIADSAGEVEAIDLTTGVSLWKQKISDGELLGPTLWNGALWLSDDRGMIIRLGRDGSKQAEITLSGRVERAPVVTPSGVLARTGLGILTLLR